MLLVLATAARAFAVGNELGGHQMRMVLSVELVPKMLGMANSEAEAAGVSLSSHRQPSSSAVSVGRAQLARIKNIMPECLMCGE